MVREISTLAYPKGKTATGDGINLVASQIFNTAGDRPDVINILVLITDGTPTVPSEIDDFDPEQVAKDAADRAKSTMTIFTIGLTLGVDEDLLRELSFDLKGK